MINLSIVSSICPVEEFHKPFYVHAKNSFFQYRLLKAGKAGQDVYEEDKYRQPQIKIKENFDRLDDKTKALVLEFVKREV